MSHEQKPALPKRRDPTPNELELPMFNAIWEAIKSWDLRRTPGAGYAGASGTDAIWIMDHILAPAAPLGNAAQEAAMFRMKQDDWIEACGEVDTAKAKIARLEAELTEWKGHHEAQFLLRQKAEQELAKAEAEHTSFFIDAAVAETQATRLRIAVREVSAELKEACWCPHTSHPAIECDYCDWAKTLDDALAPEAAAPEVEAQDG